MKRSPRFTQGFTQTLNPKLERFIRVNPTAVELIKKKLSLGPQNGKWLKRASFIHCVLLRARHNSPKRVPGVSRSWIGDISINVNTYLCTATYVNTYLYTVTFIWFIACCCGRARALRSACRACREVRSTIYIYIYIYIYICIDASSNLPQRRPRWRGCT